MKKFLLVLSVVMLSQATIWAYDFEDDGIYYNITSESEVAVTYKGTESSSSNSYSGEITIPETVTYDGNTYSVTAIGDDAFWLCLNLTSVTIGENVKTIGSYAFGRSTISSIVIPDNVIEIVEYAFYYCTGLTEVTMGNKVTTIGESAFRGCSQLAQMIIPNSVTSIGNHAFRECTNMTSLTIGENVTIIGRYAFYECRNLTGELIIPNSVTEIGDEAFYHCMGLTSVTIGENVKTIGAYAFDYCSGLRGELIIPNSVETIGNSAFYQCSNITSLTIGENVTDISDSAFYKCTSLTKVTIGDKVTTIGRWVFDSCAWITSVTIGASVSSIGELAFDGCTRLAEIHSKNPTPPAIESNTFKNVNKETCVVYVPEGCTEIYSTTTYWKEFFNIEEDTTGIDEVGIDGETDATEVARYTIDGRQISAPQKGVNIILYSDGSAKKVLVK